jgi:hypothetical protein
MVHMVEQKLSEIAQWVKQHQELQAVGLLSSLPDSLLISAAAVVKPLLQI